MGSGRNLLIGGAVVGGLIALAVYASQKLADAKDNIKWFITNFRIHGIVNNIFLRIALECRVFNNSTLSVSSVKNLNIQLQVESNGTWVDMGFIPNVITDLNLKAGESAVKSVNFDINLFTAGPAVWSALRKGKLNCRTITTFYVFGIRQSIPYPLPMEVPPAITSAINSIIPGGKAVEGIYSQNGVKGIGQGSQQITSIN